MTLQDLINLALLLASLQLKEKVAIRIRKLLLLIILALNLHILFMQSSWQQFLKGLRIPTGGPLPPNIPPRRHSSFLIREREIAKKKVDYHPHVIEQVCSRPGCRGNLCLGDCSFLAEDIKIGKQPHYIVHGRGTHVKAVNDPEIENVLKLGDTDFKGKSEPQYLGLLKEPQPLSEGEFQKTFKKHSQFSKYLPKIEGEPARILHEVLKDKNL
jgi:hypothetical protein